jgi:hypothetical protein
MPTCQSPTSPSARPAHGAIRNHTLSRRGLSRATLLYVEGRPQAHGFPDERGKERSGTEVVAVFSGPVALTQPGLTIEW